MRMSQQDLPNKSGRVINRSELKIETGFPHISHSSALFLSNKLRVVAQASPVHPSSPWAFMKMPREAVHLADGDATCGNTLFAPS